jgi:hypothetical protein
VVSPALEGASNDLHIRFLFKVSDCLLSVLDRVKNFLPLIEKANKELEETIRHQGASAVQIDADLLQPESAPLESSNGGEGSAAVKEVKDCIVGCCL